MNKTSFRSCHFYPLIFFLASFLQNTGFLGKKHRFYTLKHRPNQLSKTKRSICSFPFGNGTRLTCSRSSRKKPAAELDAQKQLCCAESCSLNRNGTAPVSAHLLETQKHSSLCSKYDYNRFCSNIGGKYNRPCCWK